MSRKEFIDKLPAEQKKQLEELKKHNSEAMKANEIIKGSERRPEGCDAGREGC